MSRQKPWVRGLVLASAGAIVLWGMADQWTGNPSALASDRTVGPRGSDDDDNERKHASPSATKSSPIAITGDNKLVWSVNPDNNSVSVFRVANRGHSEVTRGQSNHSSCVTDDLNWCACLAALA